METVLLDTNILSFLLKNDTRRALYKLHLQNRILAISFMTIAELYQWAVIHKWGARRLTEFETTLQRYVVLPFDIELCRRWGEIRAARRATGRPISVEDAWVAATALHHNIPLVTHNPKDFRHIGDLDIITELR
jgi:predicted nucleic acid-binding protein